MNTLKKSILFLVAITLFSCQKDEDVKPATNPRFSVAQVQEIGMQGIQVGANMYEYGTDEIKEYGFVISSYPNPRVQPLARIKKTGKPEPYFELIITAALQKGTTYYVESFVITENFQVYSETVSYVSTGTGGFIVENFNFKPKVYFGDTVEVVGTDFSVGQNEMGVKIFGKTVPFIPENKNSFKFILSDELIPFIDNQSIELPIEISDKNTTREYRRVVTFADPEFDIFPTKGVDWRDTLRVTGKYLLSRSIQITYDGKLVAPISKNHGEYLLPVYTDEVRSESPRIVVRMWNKFFELGNPFRINPSFVDPGQTFSFNGNETIVVKGHNFAPFGANSNNLVDENGNSISYYQSPETNGKQLVIQFERNTTFEGRLLSIRVQNFDQVSENSFSLKNNNPLITIQKYSSPLYGYELKSVSIGENGYFTHAGTLYRVSLTGSFPREKVVDLPEGLGERFFLTKAGEKIYVGGGTNVYNYNLQAFYEIDPISKSVINLPDIPVEITGHSRIFTYDGNLFFEGGWFKNELVEAKFSNSRYKFDIESNLWEKVDSNAEALSSLSYFQPDITFSFQNNIYSIQNRQFGSDKKIQILNKSTLTWETVLAFNQDGRFISNEPLVIGNEVFLALENHFIRIDLFSMEAVEIPNKSFNYLGNSFFQPSFFFGKKGFFHSQDILVEFDPAYLD